MGIAKSFHESMKARIRVDGEEIEVEKEDALWHRHFSTCMRAWVVG